MWTFLWLVGGTVLLGSAPAQAQGTGPLLTAEEMRREAEGCSVTESFSAKLEKEATSQDSTRFRAAVQKLFEQVEAGAPYDLASLSGEIPSVSFGPSSDGLVHARRISSPGDVAGAEPFLENGATHAATSISPTDNRKRIRFFEIRKDGYYIHGYAFTGFRTHQQVIDPPLRALALSFKPGTSWSSTAGETRYDNKLVDAGALVTPQGRVSTLAIAGQAVEKSDTDTTVTDQITFRRRHGNGIAGTIEMGEADGLPEVGFVDWTDLDVGTEGDGTSTYCNYVGRQPVAFLRPEDWTVAELPAEAGLVGRVLIRDSTAAKELSSGSISISTGKKMRLRADGNVMIGFSTAGDLDPRASLEQTLRQVPLENSSVVEEPTSVSIAGRSALEAKAQGTDADGRSVLYREIAVPVDETLMTITVLRPTSLPGHVEKRVQTVLKSLALPSSEES